MNASTAPLSSSVHLARMPVPVMLLSGRPSTDALEWVGPMAAIGLGVVILIATVPRRHRDADDEPPEDGPMGDGTQAAGQ